MRLIYFLLFIKTIFILTACGGGDGNGGGEVLPPTNSAPTISLSSDMLNLPYLGTGSISVAVSDKDNDSFDVEASFKSPVEGIDFALVADKLTVRSVAGKYSPDAVIVIKATDEHGAISHKEIKVNIKSPPIGEVPELGWVGQDTTPIYAVIENTENVFYFNSSIDNLENINFDIKFDLLAGTDTTLLAGIKYSIDAQSKALKVRLPNVFEMVTVGVTLVATSGETESKPLNMLLKSRPYSMSATIELSKNIHLKGVTSEVDINTNSLLWYESPLNILTLGYEDPDVAKLDPLNITLVDKDTFKVVPNLDAPSGYVYLKFAFQRTDTIISVFVVPLYIMGEEQSHERIVLEMRDDYLKRLQFAGEYDRVANYANDELLLKGAISQVAYLDNQLKIKSKSYAAKYGEYSILVSYLGSILDLGQLNTTEDLADALVADIVYAQSLVEQNVQNLYDIVDFTNRLLEKNSIIGKLQQEVLLPLENGNYSRFIGNDAYGQYLPNGAWEFDQKFNFLKALL